MWVGHMFMCALCLVTGVGHMFMWVVIRWLQQGVLLGGCSVVLLVGCSVVLLGGYSVVLLGGCSVVLLGGCNKVCCDLSCRKGVCCA